MRLRRKTMPERLREPHAAFEAQAERVEAARTALLGCMPTGRVARAPVPVGLELLRDELREVQRELDAWRVAEVEARWQACARSIELVLERIPSGIERAEGTDDGGVLLNVVANVVGPLDTWATAEEAWRDLRE